MKQDKFISGVVPSPEDSRDYPISRLIAQANVFPEEFYSIPLASWKVKDQGQVGSCVAHSLSYCKDIKEYDQCGKTTYKLFSPGYIYANRATTDYQGEGMMPREALKSLKDFGCCLQADFTYNETYPEILKRFTPVKATLNTKAAPYKITAYARLYTVADIKNALMQIGPVSIMTKVFDEWFAVDRTTGIIRNPANPANLAGYHETTLIGWNKQGFILANSWGNWGLNGKGYAILPYDYVIEEAWSLTDTILPHIEVLPVNQKYYRVQVGAFSVLATALLTQSKLLLKGYKSYIVKQNNMNKVQVGSCATQAEADTLARKIKLSGFTTYVVYS
jgi:C1A family cysteine protease